MELSVIKETFKKNYIYILVFFLFLILNIILLELSPTGYSYDEVIKLIGIPNKIGKILIIYKIILFYSNLLVKPESFVIWVGYLFL